MDSDTRPILLHPEPVHGSRRFFFISALFHKRPVILGALLLALVFTVESQAEVYRWGDENGKVYFSDRPVRNVASEKVELRINTYKGVTYDTSIFETKDELVMYVASWCGICKKAKRYFEKNNISYKAYDIEKSRKGKADYSQLGATGVPVILLGKKRMNGFSERGFQRFYEN